MFFFNGTKYLIIFYFYIIPSKKILFSFLFFLSFLFHTSQSHNFIEFSFSFSIFKFSFIFSDLSFSFKIVINSSWLISMSINACTINVSILLSLLLANIRILSCFSFFFPVIFNNFLVIPVVREKKSKTCTCNSNWRTSNTCKRTNRYSCLCYQKQLHIYLIFYCIIFFH